MNKGKFLQISPWDDEQIYIYAFTHIKWYQLPYHCVLVLIGCRIDLLLFVPTNKIVSLLLIITKSNYYEKNQTNINPFPKIIYGPQHIFFQCNKVTLCLFFVDKGVFPWVCLGIVFIPLY